MKGRVDVWKEWMERMDGCYVHGPTENMEESDRRRKWWMWIREGRGKKRKVSRTFELKPLAKGSEEETQVTKELQRRRPMSMNIVFRKAEHSQPSELQATV